MCAPVALMSGFLCLGTWKGGALRQIQQCLVEPGFFARMRQAPFVRGGSQAIGPSGHFTLGQAPLWRAPVLHSTEGETKWFHKAEKVKARPGTVERRPEVRWILGVCALLFFARAGDSRVGLFTSSADR